MRFLRKIAGFLGFSKDDSHDVKNEDEEVESDNQAPKRVHMQETGPRRGFSVPVQVAVNVPQPGPILVPSSSGDGGVQGLTWYAKRLRVDEDGDVAEQFLDEVLPEMPTSTTTDHHKPYPRFQINNRNRLAKVENQVILQEGKLQQCIEHQGRLLLV